MISVVNKLEGSPVLIDGHLGVAPTTKSGEDIAKEIERLLTLAQDQYILLSSQQKWNGVGHPGRSSFIVNNVSTAPCWNCGQEGHKAADCKKPCNQAAYDCNRQLIWHGGGGQGRGRGRGGGRGRGSHGRFYKWRPPTEQEHNKQIIDGKWYNWNPKADGNKGRWFVMNPQPGEKQAAPAANVAGSTASQATTTVPTSLVPLVPSPHTLYVITDTLALTEMMSSSGTPGGSVAQV